jgi:hypothetical protein
MITFFLKIFRMRLAPCQTSGIHTGGIIDMDLLCVTGFVFWITGVRTGGMAKAVWGRAVGVAQKGIDHKWYQWCRGTGAVNDIRTCQTIANLPKCVHITEQRKKHKFMAAEENVIRY